MADGSEDFGGRMRESVPLWRFSTYRIGGPARFFLEAGSAAEAARGFAWAAERNLPVFVLGGGSNVLFDDAGFDGLIIRLTGPLAEFSVDETWGVALAGGGVRLKVLGRALVRLGYGDFLFMTGIPGTVGGAVAMNAGTREGEVKDVFITGQLLSPSGDVRQILPGDLAFSYRHSSLRESGEVLLWAEFRLGVKRDRVALEGLMKAHLAERRGREPKIRKNCGSVFKAAPDGTPAGLLIDRAGLKGLRVGDAMVALEHANWIVNLGAATAGDVRQLAGRISEGVLAHCGVALAREVIFVPQDTASGV